MSLSADKSITPIVHFGSHLPVLIRAMAITSGPALEMGMGMNSSLVMHWMCASDSRPLVSYENSPEYFHYPLRAGKFASDFHQVVLVDDWDKADIEKPWDVAFLDHGPAERRIVDIKRLANFAKYIIIHDSEGRRDSQFHYREIYPLFKWKFDYHKFMPKTSVLSNFVDLSNFTTKLNG